MNARGIRANATALALLCLLFRPHAWAEAQTNTNPSALSPEEVRSACVQGRRYVCGKVLQIVPKGLVVDSGYKELLKPPLNRTWVTSGRASLSAHPGLVEENRPDAICIGPVFLTAYPNKPEVKLYDYVALHVYPAGQQSYSPAPGLTNTVRRFSGSLEKAIEFKRGKGI